jgi:hypothetical protein
MQRHIKELATGVDLANEFNGINAEPEFFDSEKFPNVIEKIFGLNNKLSAKTVHDPLGLTSIFPEIKFGTSNICNYIMYTDNCEEEIRVIPQGWCHSKAIYLGALVHECIHATGVSHRLNRNSLISGFELDRHKEECVAQSSAYIVLKHLGLADDLLTKMTYRYLKRHKFEDQNKDKLIKHVDRATHYILERLK